MEQRTGDVHAYALEMDIFTLWRRKGKESVREKKRETISLKACNVRNNCENNAIYKSFYGFYFFKAISSLHCD